MAGRMNADSISALTLNPKITMPLSINVAQTTTATLNIAPIILQPVDLDTIIGLLEAAGISSPNFPFTSANLLHFNIDRKNDGVVDGNGNSLLYFQATIQATDAARVAADPVATSAP